MNYYVSAWKKYAEFSGRSQRAEYWTFTLVNAAIGIIFNIIGVFSGGEFDVIGIIAALFALAAFIPSIAVSVRRMHDTGRSGWWILIALIPVIGTIWFLILALLDSESGQNQYGPNPKSA